VRVSAVTVTVFGAATMAAMAASSIALAQNAAAEVDPASPDRARESGYMPSSRIRVVNLSGSPQKPGPYRMRVSLPPDFRDGPHSHSDTRQVSIVSGTWYFGQGDGVDPASAKKMSPGDKYVEPANAMHYTFTTTEAAVVEISGTGRSTTVYNRKPRGVTPSAK
jgi:hypothetical protein